MEASVARRCLHPHPDEDFQRLATPEGGTTVWAPLRIWVTVRHPLDTQIIQARGDYLILRFLPA